MSNKRIKLNSIDNDSKTISSSSYEEEDIQQYKNEPSLFNILSSNCNLNELDQSFMYSQLLKETILEIEYDDDTRKLFADFCRVQYSGNERMLYKIDKFENNYKLYSPIWWYTKESFIYSTLNQALRTLHPDIVIKMGFFMKDLHQQIEDLHIKTSKDELPRIVYRGQGILNDEFENLKNSNGSLLSFNNFLSTSLDQDVAFIYADSSKDDPTKTGIRFRIEIDPLISSIPFVELKNIGNHEDEKEVLFSMHTIFRIRNMYQIEDRLWEVTLTLTDANDEKLLSYKLHTK